MKPNNVVHIAISNKSSGTFKLPPGKEYKTKLSDKRPVGVSWYFVVGRKMGVENQDEHILASAKGMTPLAEAMGCVPEDKWHSLRVVKGRHYGRGKCKSLECSKMMEKPLY